MEKIVVVGLLLAMAVAGDALAGSNCWTIEDADRRALCRAVETRNVAQCSTILDFELRQACRARVGGNPSACASLSSEWERRECRRRAGGGKKE